MNDKYKLISEKGPELNNTNLTFLNRNYLVSEIIPTICINHETDETRPMKVEIEIRKFGFWCKS